MSTVTVSLSQGQLQWWRMRLPANKDGYVMVTHLSKDGGPLGDKDAFTDADQAVYEIFDGCDGELDWVSVIHETHYSDPYLYVLSYGKPSQSDLWQPLEKVALYPQALRPPEFMRDELFAQGIHTS